MNIRFRYLLLLAWLVVASAPAMASTERAWSKLQASLELTERQVERLKPMLARYQRQRRADLKAFREQVKEALSPEQAARFAESLRDHASQRARQCTKDRDSRYDSALQRMTAELSLTDKQQERIRLLIVKMRARLKDDREEFLEEAATILKPEQKVTLRKLLQHHEETPHTTSPTSPTSPRTPPTSTPSTPAEGAESSPDS